MQMTFRNPPENYFFMKWSWSMIRKVAVWFYISTLLAMVAIVVAMVWTLPRKCNPQTKWYQGGLMYEIFPASFSDSNQDGIGDLRGISSRVDYLSSLGVTAIRLNSIFPAPHYPEGYHNVSNNTEIAYQLGTFRDFGWLLDVFHSRNISVVLDLPVEKSANDDSVLHAISFWTERGVDGFYLKGLEQVANSSNNFTSNLKTWKRSLGEDKLLMVSSRVVELTPPESLNTVLNNVDMIDVFLEVGEDLEALTKQIKMVLNGTLFSITKGPWVHWSIGNSDHTRMANRFRYANATLGANLLQMMLPGTPSIFYGDEIGLRQVSNADTADIHHLHQLGIMMWEHPSKPFTRNGVLPWIHGQASISDFAQSQVIANMSYLRASSPAIYMNSVNKDGVTKANAEVKYSKKNLLVMQRWYPRRKTYVVVSNLGDDFVVEDLSKTLYSGEVVVGSRSNFQPESVSFKDISLLPGESVIIVLD